MSDAINSKRDALNKLVEESGLSAFNEETLKTSMEMDELIIQYHKNSEALQNEPLKRENKQQNGRIAEKTV